MGVPVSGTYQERAVYMIWVGLRNGKDHMSHDNISLDFLLLFFAH